MAPAIEPLSSRQFLPIASGLREAELELSHSLPDPRRFKRTTMSLLQANDAMTETEALRLENEALKDQLARLSQANISVSGNLDTEAVLQEVVNSA